MSASRATHKSLFDSKLSKFQNKIEETKEELTKYFFVEKIDISQERLVGYLCQTGILEKILGLCQTRTRVVD